MDLTPWLEYFTKGLSMQMLEIQAKSETTITAETLTRIHKLSDRQKKAIEYLLEHGEIRIQEYMSLYKTMTQRTLRRDLKDLVELGLLTACGAAKMFTIASKFRTRSRHVSRHFLCKFCRDTCTLRPVLLFSNDKLCVLIFEKFLGVR